MKTEKSVIQMIYPQGWYLSVVYVLSKPGTTFFFDSNFTSWKKLTYFKDNSDWQTQFRSMF